MTTHRRMQFLSGICVFLFACSSATTPDDTDDERPDWRATGEVGESWMLDLTGGGHARCSDAWLVSEDTYVLVGGAVTSDFGDLQIWALAVNVHGEILWQHLLGDGEALGLAPDGNGGVVIAAYMNADGGSDLELLVLHLDSEGEILWQTQVGGTGGQSGGSIVPAIGGGYLILGSLENSETYERDMWFVAISEEGDVTSQRFLRVPGSQYGQDLLATRTGYYATASRLLVKLDADGEVEWARTFAADLETTVSSLAEGDDGGVVLAGTIDNPTNGGEYNQDIWLASVDGGGSILWQRAYGGDDTEQWPTVTRALDGDLVVSAGALSFHSNAAWVFRVNSRNGDLLWGQLVMGHSLPTAVVESAGENLLIAGQGGGYSTGDPTITFAQLTEDGEIEGDTCDFLLPVEGGVFEVEGTLNPASVNLRNSSAEQGPSSLSARAWDTASTMTCPHSPLEFPGGEIVEGGEPDERSWALRFHSTDLEFEHVRAVPYPDGDIAVVARKSHGGDGHFWSARLSPTGEVRWQRRLECSSSGDVPNRTALSATSEGGLVVVTVGGSEDYGMEGPPICTTAVGAAGDLRWSRLYRTEAGEPLIDARYYFEAASVSEAPDGDLIIAAYTSVSAGNVRLLRTSPDGELRSHRIIEPAQYTHAAIATHAGGVVILGQATPHGALVVSFGASDELLWSIRIVDFLANSIIETDEGDFLLTGSAAVSADAAMAVVLSDDGGFRSAVSLGGPMESSYPAAAVALADGSFIMAGVAEISRSGESRMWFARLTATGESLWQRTFGNEPIWSPSVLVAGDHLVLVGRSGHDLFATSMSHGGVMGSGCSALRSWSVDPQSHDLSSSIRPVTTETTEIELYSESVRSYSSPVDVGVEQICPD